MADKRMLSSKIICSDAFMDMPLSTQALYMHLNMNADDEGFIGNPRRIQRMIGSNEDDLKILIGKRFILSFETGVVVVKHWNMHNKIRKDRLKETQYIEEKSKLSIKENGSYTDVLDSGRQLADKCQTDVSIDKDRLDKDRLDKDRLDKDRLDKDSIVDVDFEETTPSKEERHKFGEYKHVLLTDKQYEKLIKDFGEAKVKIFITKVDEYIQMNKGKKYSDFNLVIRSWIKNERQFNKPKSSNFNNFEQRNTDFEKTENDLLGWIKNGNT